MSASSSEDAARAPILPTGARRRGATSCAPTIRTPSRSMIAAMPSSSPLSPRRNSCASSGARLTAPQSNPKVCEFRPRHRAYDHHFGDGAFLQGGKELADFAHAHPDMGVGFDARIGRADDADKKGLAAGAPRLAGDLERKGAPAAENSQRSRGCGSRPAP